MQFVTHCHQTEKLPREPHYRARPAPELLKAVVLTQLGREDVYHDVAEVYERPANILGTFVVATVGAVLFQRLLQFTDKGAKLKRRLSRG